MTVDQFLDNRLESLKDKVEFTPDEQKMLDLGQLSEFLAKRITSKKFRRNKLSDQTIETIRNKVELSVENNKPLYFIFGFGGFKSADIPEHHPHPGWGEVFNLIFITKLLAPLLQVYKPGVIFEYESENAGVFHGNNSTKEDNDTYDADFKNLLKFFEKYVPTNLDFRYMKLEAQYDTTPMFAAVEKRLPEEIAKLKSMPVDELDPAVRRATHNLKISGRKDLSKLTTAELREEAIKSLARCYVFLEEDYSYRERYFNGEERIMTIGSYCTVEENPDNWIAINSTSHSSNAFWTSRGILVEEGDSFYEMIIGPGQYEEVKPRLRLERTDVVASVVDNMDKIPVLPAK